MYVDRQYFFSKINKRVLVVERNTNVPFPVRNVNAIDSQHIGPSIIVISYLRSPA